MRDIIRRKILFSEKLRFNKIGYRTISTIHTKRDENINELLKKECSIIFQETISSEDKEKNQPQLKEAIKILKKNDELVVNSLSDIGANKQDIIDLLYSLQEKGIHIKTLDGLVDTRSLGELGLAIVGMILGLNNIDKSIIKSRSISRISQKRRAGENVGGRPKTNQIKTDLVIKLRKEGDSYRDIREKTGLALSTIRRIILEFEKEFHKPDQ